MARGAGKELQVVDREGNVAVGGELDRLARIFRFELRQILRLVLHQLRELVQYGAALARRLSRPAAILERLLSGANGLIDGACVRIRYLGNRLLGGRVQDHASLSKCFFSFQGGGFGHKDSSNSNMKLYLFARS